MVLSAATAAAAAVVVVYEYISTERCAPSSLVLISKPELAPADCSLASERRAARRLRVGRDATSRYSCVTIRIIDCSAAACCCGKRSEFRAHFHFHI